MRLRFGLLLALALSPCARAQDLFTSGPVAWSVTTNGWSTVSGGQYTNNWVNGSRAVFEGGGVIAGIVIGETIAASGLVFQADAVRITGPGALTFTNANTVTVGAGFTGTVSNNFTSALGLRKLGDGALELASAGARVSGRAEIEAGRLRLRDTIAFQGAITNSGQVLEMTGVTANAWTYTNRVTGTGAWMLTGPGQADRSSWTFSGDNRGFRGALTIAGSRFNATAASALPSGSIAVLPGGELLLNAASTFTNNLSIASNGWANTAYAGGIGALRLAANANYSGTLALTADARVGAQGDAGTISGVITGPFNLSKGGTGTITLSGSSANTYGGTTHVRGGTLVLAKTAGVNAVPGDLHIGDGSTSDVVQLGASEQIPDTAFLRFTGAVNHWGYFKLMGRTETVAGLAETSANGVIENVESEASVPGDGTLILIGDADQTFSGYMRSRAGGSSTNLLRLVKNGNGTLTLANGNITHTGTTTLNGGALTLLNATGFASPIQNNGRRLTFHRTTTGGSTYARSITGTGEFRVTGTGVLGVGDLTLAATNTTFTADTVVENSRVIVSNPNFLPAGTRTARNGGQFWLGGTNQVYPQDFTISGNGWPEGTYPTGLGAFRFSGSARLTGTVTLEGPARIGAHGNDAGFFNATVNGAHPLEKFGGGVIYVDTASGHNGPLTVTSGYWVARHALALGTPAEPTTVKPGGTLQLELASTNVTTLVVNGETAMLEGLGVGNARGALASWTGTNTWNGPVILNSPTNGVYVQTQRLILPRPVTENVAGAILRKQGGGSLFLTGSEPSAWTGRTEVQAGALHLAKDPGVRSIPGNLQMGAGDTNQPHVFLEAQGQLRPDAVISSPNPWGGWGRFNLNGFDTTVAGITNLTGALVIQNEGIAANGARLNPPSATLTVSNATEFVFGGHMRDRDNTSNPTTLSLTKRGPGRLVFQRPTGQAARINYTGTTRLLEGTLRLVDLNGAGGVSFNSPLEVGAGTTLEIHSTQTMATKWLFTRPLSGPGTIIKTGSGVFGMTNVISPSGVIEVREGRLMSDNNASNWSASTAQLSVLAGAEFDMRADPVTLGCLNGAGTVTNTYGGGGTDLLTLGAGGHSGNFSGILRATGDGASGENRGRIAIRKTGAGTQQFSGGVQIFGPVTVAAGTLRVSGWMSTPTTDVDILAFSVFHLDGGSITNANTRVREDALLHGCGRLAGNLVNDGTVALDCPGSDLTVFGNVTNNGRMRLINGNAVTATGTFVNNGILDLITGDQTLPANFTNNGTVIFSSSVQAVNARDDAGAFTVSIDTQPGHNYQLQRADGPAGPWNDLGAAQAGTGTRLEFTDPNPAPESRRYYRFKVDP